MQLNSSICIMDKANHIVKAAGSREPELIADYLGIIIMPVDFAKQKGVYKEIERNRFIFIKKTCALKCTGSFCFMRSVTQYCTGMKQSYFPISICST